MFQTGRNIIFVEIMGFILFILFVVLSASLVLSLVKSPKKFAASKIFRIASVVFGVSVLSFWFFQQSIERFEDNAISVQVANLLPQPIDFYIIEGFGTSKIRTVRHLGKIRPEYYRLEYLDVSHSSEFWVAGYLGKKNLVYFTQNMVPNKNMDQIIEVKNYIIQNENLSESAKKNIEAYNSGNIKYGIWTTMDLLLLFLNIILVLRKEKNHFVQI